MNFRKAFAVKPGHKLKLSSIDPDAHAGIDKADAFKETEALAAKLAKLQYLLYAEGRHSLLIVLQASDAAGKDGTISSVLASMNPQGTRVCAFKVPSAEEASHDFLWRAHQRTPARGEVVVFNRSHYEDVLIVRVHELVPKSVWSKRYDLINDFEKNLVANGTIVLKFFLHISKKEQLERFKDRLDDPDRQWKISAFDYTEREFWPQYTEAYEDALSKTSTPEVPWFVIPANRKWFRNLAISRIVVDALSELGMKVPAATVDVGEIRKKYFAASKRKA